MLSACTCIIGELDILGNVSCTSSKESEMTRCPATELEILDLPY
jgi:hypothetical protein